jgi:hypothetical protein
VQRMTLKPPSFLSDDDRARLDPKRPLTPQQKRMGLTMLVAQLQRELSAPNCPLGPLQVRVDTRPDGWSLHVDVPPPGPNELELPGSH